MNEYTQNAEKGPAVARFSLVDLREYREVSLAVQEAQTEVAEAQTSLLAAQNAQNRFHQRMEEKYGYWLGRHEPDFVKGVVTITEG